MIGVRGIFWQSPFGEVLDLFATAKEGIRYKVLMDEEGLFAPLLHLGSFKLPQQGGERLNFSRVGVREISLPVHVSGNDAEELRRAIENLGVALRPSMDENGVPEVGKILYHFDNQIRFLKCVFAGGLEKTKARGEGYVVFNLRFVAHDPFWYAIDEQVNHFSFEASFTSWFPWQLPWTTSIAGIFATLTIDLIQSWQVSPIFEIRGPVKEVVLLNERNGKQFRVNYDLAMDEILTVDMATKTVLNSAEENLWAFCEGEMWDFLPGKNNLVLQLSDATQASEVVLRYRERFFTV